MFVCFFHSDLLGFSVDGSDQLGFLSQTIQPFFCLLFLNTLYDVGLCF